MYQLKKSPLAINNHIKSKLFEILNTIASLKHQTIFQGYSPCAYDEHGNQLPLLMCQWLDGTMSCNDIKTLIFDAIEQHPEWFDCSGEKNAVINIITMIFTPEHFVATRKIYRQGVLFIKECKKKGHRVYALSNWDIESFDLLCKKFPQLFNLFDGIVISGESNNLKPSPDIYTTLISRYNINPQKCWFIDDQKENVAAASLLGMHGILCSYTGIFKKPDFHLIAQKINDIHYQSVTRREKRRNKGIIPNTTKNANNPIMVGEKMS
jgi:methionine salvage enolase-phosphatase E1